MSTELGRHRFDIGMPATEEEFQRSAIEWLQQQVGFDGIVWGSGKRLRSGIIVIEKFLLDGRSEKLVEDYAQIAGIDPVSQRFSLSPQIPQNINAFSFYRKHNGAAVLEYLEHYRIRHLFLVGVRQSMPASLEWIVLYREDSERPFDDTMNALTASAISTVLHGAQFRRAADALMQMSSMACPSEKSRALRLTGRQQQVLEGLRSGLSNKAIARELAISENTLKTHLAALYRTMNVTSRTQAIVRAGIIAGQR